MKLVCHSAEDRTYWKSGGVLVFLIVALFGRKFDVADTGVLLFVAVIAGSFSWWCIDYGFTRRRGLRVERVGFRQPVIEVRQQRLQVARVTPEGLTDWMQKNSEWIVSSEEVHLVGLKRDEVMQFRRLD